MYPNYRRSGSSAWDHMSEAQKAEYRRVALAPREDQERWEAGQPQEPEPTTWQAPQTPEEDEAMIVDLKRLIGG